MAFTLDLDVLLNWSDFVFALFVMTLRTNLQYLSNKPGLPWLRFGFKHFRSLIVATLSLAMMLSRSGLRLWYYNGYTVTTLRRNLRAGNGASTLAHAL